MSTKKIAPGSQLCTLLKLFLAKRAIIALFPNGGLTTADPEMYAAYMELDKRFYAQCELCHLRETEALELCSAEVD
jgi:hypothetical protein